MAEHLREQTIPEEMVAMADYYLRGVKRAEVAGTAAIPRQDMPVAVAQALGLDVTRTATHEEVVNLLQGRRADGEEIVGRQTYKVGPGRDRITYVDFTFSAPKSVSVAMALAPTDAERPGPPFGVVTCVCSCMSPATFGLATVWISVVLVPSASV